MQKIGFKLLVSLGLISVMAVTKVWAQPGAGMGGGRGEGWGAQDTYGRMFNPKTVEKVTGELVSVESFTPVKREQQVMSNNFMECRLLKDRGEKGEWCRTRGIYRPQGRGRWRAPA